MYLYLCAVGVAPRCMSIKGCIGIFADRTPSLSARWLPAEVSVRCGQNFAHLSKLSTASAAYSDFLHVPQQLSAFYLVNKLKLAAKFRLYATAFTLNSPRVSG